jgi:antitoxin component of MazEF toxin-antitoxin module
MKSLYALQPYKVGSKERKSLAIIIPSKVVKQCNVDASTVFTLQVDEDKKRLMLQMIDKVITNNGANIAAVEDGLSTQ